MTYTLAALASLQALDVLTTAVALRAGAVEANPIGRLLLENGGLSAIMFAKVAAVLAVTLIVLVIPAPGLALARFVLQLANVAMAFVVLSNAGIALR